MPDFAARRKSMVEKQLAARDIGDQRVLDAMGKVPREEFVPEDWRDMAYADQALPIAENQTISQPYVVAEMAQAAELTPQSHVLEIGTGSGYAAAVLAEIAAEVFTIERIPALAEASAAVLKRLGYDNVYVRCGDGTLGWPEQAPFDAILVTAGSPVVPESLRSELKIGGKMIIPVGMHQGFQTLMIVERTGENTYTSVGHGSVAFVPLVGEFGWRDSDQSQR